MKYADYRVYEVTEDFNEAQRKAKKVAKDKLDEQTKKARKLEDDTRHIGIDLAQSKRKLSQAEAALQSLAQKYGEKEIQYVTVKEPSTCPVVPVELDHEWVRLYNRSARLSRPYTTGAATSRSDADMYAASGVTGSSSEQDGSNHQGNQKQ